MTKHFSKTVTKTIEAREIKVGDTVKVGDQDFAVTDAYRDYDNADKFSIRLTGLPRALYSASAAFTVVRDEREDVPVGTIVSLHKSSLDKEETLFVKVVDTNQPYDQAWLSVSRAHHGFGRKFRNNDILDRLDREEDAAVVQAKGRYGF